MKQKRILAMILCLCLVLSCVPGLDVYAAAAEQSLIIEAENTDYAVWNKYSKTENNANASGGVMAAGGGGYFGWFDDPNSDKDLVNGFIDKSNSTYVAFYVKAEQTGTYYLSSAGTFYGTKNYLEVAANGGENYYAAIVVNPAQKLTDADATVAYKANYIGGNTVASRKTYCTTEAVAVTLQKGLNVIYVQPLTYEQDGPANWTDESKTQVSGACSWANVDCLKISGQFAVEPVKAQETVLHAGDAPYVYGYTTINAGANVGDGGWAENTIAISNMSTSNVEKLRSFTYTVNAPENGYYDITAEYDTAANGSDTRAIGLLVDGNAYAYEFKHLDNTNTSGGKVNLSVYLTEGDHVLTFTAPAKRTAEDTCGNNVSWFNYNEIYLYGGLTKSVIQSNPKLDWWYAEAEYKDEGYALWHTYSTTENSNDAKRDYRNAAGTVVGGGNTVNNPSLETIKTTRVNKDTVSGVTIYVKAPAAGTYSFKARYRLNNPGIWDSTNKTWKEAPYSVFMVNGDFGAQSFFNTNAQYNWTYDTYSTELTLCEGINEITFIPMTADQRKSGSDWVNVDCIFVDTDAQVVKVPTVQMTDVKPQDGAPYLYANSNSGSIGGGQLRAISTLKIHVGNAAENLQYVPSVSYTVNVPEAGYYNLKQYTSNYAAESAYAVLVDGELYAARNYVVGSKILDLSCSLPAGTHTITATILLPKDAAAAEGFGYGWMDFYGLQMDSKLSLADQQVIAPLIGMKVMEAETDGLNNPERSYNNTETPWQGSGAKVLAGAAGSNLSTEEVLSHMDARKQTFVEYLVEAPAAGQYNIAAGVQCGAVADDMRYLLLQVNGQTIKVEGIENENGAIAAVPAVVELEKGQNVIRVIGVTKTQTEQTMWMNQDYLAIDSRLTALKNTSSVAQADRASYIGNYKVYNNAGGWDGDMLGQSLAASFAAAALSVENFKDASWFSYTVNAPRDGYYSIRSKVWFAAVAEDAAAEAANVAVLADGTSYEMKCWKTAGSSNAMAEATVYLTEGQHDLIFVGVLADSNMGKWVDYDYVRLSNGLTVADQQLYPEYGLVEGSAYTVSDGIVSGVYKNTSVKTLKSNFYNLISVTDQNGNSLSDTATVPNGAVVTCADGSYTVCVYDKGDATGDGKIDIRDMKKANDFVLGINSIYNAVLDILHNGAVDMDDVSEFVQIIFGKKDSDVFYQPGSMGPEAIMEYCNPVGRVTIDRSAVFMESSASNFTITGDLKGDVVLELRAECGNSYDELGIFVEIDGVVTYHKLNKGVRNQITIASNLEAGNHVIEVSKSTDAKNDALYIYSVSYNGTVTKTEPSDKYIEFIGDSITAGFGAFANEMTTKSYYAYANTVADIFDADYYSVANGGWRFGANTCATVGEENNYIGSIYEKVSMQKDLGSYDFARQPDVIVINLGTNDAIQFKNSAEDFSQDTYNADIAALLQMIRKNNPNATVIWVYGAMNGSTDMQFGDKADMLATAIQAYNVASGDQVTFHNTLTANTAGKYQHPTAEAQARNGQEVAQIISDLTGWAAN